MAAVTAAQVGMGLAGGSAFMQYRAGQTQAKGFAAQAGYARMQSRQESIKYKQQAVAVLDNILMTSAETTARAAAGGVDPFSGSAGDNLRLAMAKGAQELYTVKDNAVISLAAGGMQADQYLLQGRAAKQAGFAAAIGTLGEGYMTGKAIR